MNSARETLQFDFNVRTFARRAPQQVEMPRNNIEILKGIVKDYGDRWTEPPEREDLRQIYRNFIAAHRSGTILTEFDSPRRTQKLAWALTDSENELPRIVDTKQLSDALQLIESSLPIRTRALLGVFDALLQAWDTPNAGILRAFVTRHLIDYEGRRSSVQNMRENLAWYCDENGATQLAMSLLRDKVKLSEVWSNLNLSDRMHNYRYFGIVGEAYVALNHLLDKDSIEDIVKFVKMNGDDKSNRACVSKTIEKLGIDAPKDLRQSVQSYVLGEGKWGDPRMSGGDNSWRYVSDKARKIFTTWITKDDLHFFFDVVAQACNDEKFAYRKAFWLAYLEHISFCRPVLRRDVVYLFRNNPQNLQYYRERRPASLTGGTFNQHAFIIQMGDYTFVEFSTAGACYVYDNARRPFSLHDPQYSMTKLRSKGSETHWQPHPGSERYLWQKNFALWLRSNVGIKRLRSYRL